MPELSLTLAVACALGFSAGALAGFATGLYAVRHAFAHLFDLLDVLSSEVQRAASARSEWEVSPDA